MKYDDFKIFKLSTILKIIDLRGYNFSKIYKNINFKRYKYILVYVANLVISIIKHIFSGIYKSVNFTRHHFVRIYESINFKKYNFSRIYKYPHIKRYNFSRIYKYHDSKRYNFSRIYKYFNITRIYKYFDIKRYKYVPAYAVGNVIFSALIYLSIPAFFNYDKSKIENLLCKDLNVKCSIVGKIKYSFIPSPRIKIKDLIVNDSLEKNKIFGKIKDVAVTIPLFHLIDKKKINYNKIKLQNAEINFDLKYFNKNKNLFLKMNSLKSVNLKKGKIKFIDGETYIATINDVNFKYNSDKNANELTLKGKFLGDNIYINLLNNKIDENSPKIFTLKLSDLRLFTKVNMFNSQTDKNVINGDILFKKDKNRVTAVFDYKNNKIIFKRANLRNIFLDGKFTGEVNFFPYFYFNLNVDLNGINFNKFHSFLNNLNVKNKKNLFKINKKINGKLNLSTDKIYSKYSLINSFESRLKFINGNILIEQLLLDLGKLGAADLTGIIKNEKKFTNLQFENNIFIDNVKRFYNKFGIYNKVKISSSLFVVGSLDLVNLIIRFSEISGDKKYSAEDISYIEKEFNEILLEDGYVSFFNYLKLKEFVRLIAMEAD